MDCFKNKRKLFLVVGCLAIALVSGGLWLKAVLSYAVDDTVILPSAVDDIVSRSIKDHGKSYDYGEYLTEGHVILDKTEENGILKLCLLTDVGSFGFQNGIFTLTSGESGIPTVITLSKNEQGEYSLLKYEAEDPFGDDPWVRRNFPVRFWAKRMIPAELRSKIDNQKEYRVLEKQQETQAENYLKSIGRTARVSYRHPDYELPTVNVYARYKLEDLSTHDPLLNRCPYWLGTREKIENGTRYIYEQSQGKTSDGYDLITFRKLKEDGGIVEKRKYKIVSSEPVLID